jgi:hypothetical protein
MPDPNLKADDNPCLDINRAEYRTGREIYLERELEIQKHNLGSAILEVARSEAKFNAIRQYIGECNAFGDEPELDTLIALVGGVDD